jgi:hypothetical protein
VNENLVPAIDDYEIGVKSVYSRHKGSTLERTLRPDALLTPLLYGYNNSLNANTQYYIGDMPNLVWREQVARQLTLKQAQHIFSEAIE